MLDVYKMTGSILPPDEPNEENFIGSFSLEEFHQRSEVKDFLKQKELRFHFFEDFRLPSEETLTVVNFAERFIHSNANSIPEAKAYRKLIDILKVATIDKAGIVAFSD